MPRPEKTESEEISRGEATILLEWIVGTLKRPQPRGGFYHLLHRTPEAVAKEYGVTAQKILQESRRKVAKPV